MKKGTLLKMEVMAHNSFLKKIINKMESNLQPLFQKKTANDFSEFNGSLMYTCNLKAFSLKQE